MTLSIECSGCKATCISNPNPTTQASAKKKKPKINKKQTVPVTQNCADTSSKKKKRPSLCDYLRQEEEEEKKIAAQLSSTAFSLENKSKHILNKYEKPAEAAVAVVEQSSDPYGDF